MTYKKGTWENIRFGIHDATFIWVFLDLVKHNIMQHTLKDILTILSYMHN